LNPPLQLVAGVTADRCVMRISMSTPFDVPACSVMIHVTTQFCVATVCRPALQKLDWSFIGTANGVVHVPAIDLAGVSSPVIALHDPDASARAAIAAKRMVGLERRIDILQ